MLNTKTRRATALVLVLTLLAALLTVLNLAAPWDRTPPARYTRVAGRQL